jgi:hypothetical protein
VNAGDDLGELPPLAALLVAYARPARRDWHRLCWQLDDRLAAVLRRAGDPTIAAIRLAWWEAALVEGDLAKGGGEPLVERWRVWAAPEHGPAAAALIDGWRLLIGAEPLSPGELAAYGARRGGGLFALLASRPLDEDLACAGAVWALWDLAAHSGEPSLASRAMAAAREQASGADRLARATVPKPLRLAHDLAAWDARAERVPVGGFSSRHYRRLLWRSLLC